MKFLISAFLLVCFFTSNSPIAVASYVALALQYTEGSAASSSVASVARGFGRSKNQSDAEARAMKQCRLSSTRPQECEIKYSFKSGCRYLSIGRSARNEAGWGASETPFEAYEWCTKLGFACELPVGGCSDPSLDTSLSKEQAASAKVPQYWVSVAIQLNNAKSTVAMSVERNKSKDVAEAQAVAKCKKRSSDPGGCKLFDSFNNGCMYYSTGMNPNGGAGWASGKTPSDAYNSCHAKNLNCEEPYGGCSNPLNDIPFDRYTRAPEIEKAPMWMAIAKATHFKVGYRELQRMDDARAATKSLAESKALDACRSNASDPSTCEIHASYNRGCYYVSLGLSPLGQRYWGDGNTPQEAYNSCSSNPANCTPPIGGCSNSKDELPVIAIKRAPLVRLYAAIAAGFSSDFEYNRASANFAVGFNEDEATSEAMKDCRQESGSTCRIVQSFNTGCAYIALGSNNFTDQMKYGTGTSPAQALQMCRAAGHNCDQEPIGGCIEEIVERNMP